MIKVLVIGAAGKMGSTIISCIEDTPDIKVCGATENLGSPSLGADVGDLAGIGRKNILITESLDQCMAACDVAIDFTTPDSSLQTLRSAVKNQKALVIGTTGFSATQKDEIKGATDKICCVLAPNMSIGVNALFKIVREAAKVLGDAYDIEIVEAHHKFKKDAPSGTAVQLSEVVANTLGRDLKKDGVYGRKGISQGRGLKEIGIHTLRAGDIVGEHRVLFGGMGETLEFIHRAQSRETFARGSITAAKWIVSQSPGLYNMEDVLGLDREK